MTAFVCVGLTEDEASSLPPGSPRRDFVELTREAGAEIVYRRARLKGRGIMARLSRFGLEQAWEVAGRTREGDVVYADQELAGISILGALALRRRQPRRVVVLAHLPGRWWKRTLLRLATRLGVPGRLILHSVEQARIMRPVLPANWELRTHPYQVDTAFWRPEQEPERDPLPLICAVGSEHRDYSTLMQAVQGLPVQLVIAAGSNWAKESRGVQTVPENVTYLDRMLSYEELRTLYSRASIVIAPLIDVPNQSGITTMLEGMSMARPLIATATRGQRECVRGPLVDAAGRLHREPTDDRGPGLMVPEARPAEASGEAPDTGLYVPVGDAGAMRAAIELLLHDEARRSALGAAARVTAERYFSIEHFARRFAAALAGGESEAGPTGHPTSHELGA